MDEVFGDANYAVGEVAFIGQTSGLCRIQLFG